MLYQKNYVPHKNLLSCVEELRDLPTVILFAQPAYFASVTYIRMDEYDTYPRQFCEAVFLHVCRIYSVLMKQMSKGNLK